MAEPEAGRRKQTELAPGKQDARFEAKEQKHTQMLAGSNRRLGHAASRTRRGTQAEENMPAACGALEPRPTKAAPQGLGRDRFWVICGLKDFRLGL